MLWKCESRLMLMLASNVYVLSLFGLFIVCLTRPGKAHLGYSRLDFTKLKLSLIGSQAFFSGSRSLSAP
jgi:hypothetical protein